VFRNLTDNFLVAPQISPDDVVVARDMGVSMIINNRPDGEEPGAPQGSDIAAASAAAGIEYVQIAVTHAGFSHPQIDAALAAIARAGSGKVLAYCRSGTRSALLWSLAQAKSGMHPAEIAARAETAGYDTSPIAAMLDIIRGQQGR
jgi:uncharacterized protein (TIGR01244 family)